LEAQQGFGKVCWREADSFDGKTISLLTQDLKLPYAFGARYLEALASVTLVGDFWVRVGRKSALRVKILANGGIWVA
jgi:hypothetical protein